MIYRLIKINTVGSKAIIINYTIELKVMAVNIF